MCITAIVVLMESPTEYAASVYHMWFMYVTVLVVFIMSPTESLFLLSFLRPNQSYLPYWVGVNSENGWGLKVGVVDHCDV